MARRNSTGLLVLLACGLTGPAWAADEIHSTTKGQTAAAVGRRATAGTVRHGLTTPSGGAITCTIFPPDNIWNTDITSLVPDGRSPTWMATIINGGTPRTQLWCGFAPITFGFQPINVDPSVPRTRITFTQSPTDWSDVGPYPFTASTPLEAGTADKEALMIEADADSCKLWELYLADWNNGVPQAAAGMVWDLRSNALKPDDRWSIDDAGLPVYPGVIRMDDVNAHLSDPQGLHHALRCETRIDMVDGTVGSHLWPARHDVSVGDGAVPDPSRLPMGARFRLKPSYNIPSNFRDDTKTILRTLQHYGAFLADVGAYQLELIGTNEQWSQDLINQLNSVPLDQFEVVDESSLMIDPDSAQARQPGADTTPPAPITDLSTAP